MTITENEVTIVISQAKKAENNHAAAISNTMAAKRTMEIARNKYMGEIEGKNVAEREANLAPMIEAETTLLIDCEKMERDTRLENTLSQLDLKRLGYLVRLMEINKQ